MDMEAQALNGRAINMRNSMVLLIKVLLNSSILCNHRCSINRTHRLLHCRHKIIIRTTLLKHTNLSSLLCRHSMALSSLHNSFSLLQLLLMVTVCHLSSLLMLDRHNSGQVLLSKLVPLSIILVVEVASIMGVEVMNKLL